MALFPALPRHSWVFEKTLLGLALLLGREVLLGAALGLVASLVFTGVKAAGELLGIQMGLSIASVFDPAESGQTSLIAELQGLLAVLLFLLVDGHHAILRALAYSLEQVPPGGGLDPAALAAAVVPMAGSVFLMTLQIGAPVLGALFLTDAALGFVARAVPQMSVFIVGIPLKIGIGILLMVVTTPLFATLLNQHFNRLGPQLIKILSGM